MELITPQGPKRYTYTHFTGTEFYPDNIEAVAFINAETGLIGELKADPPFAIGDVIDELEIRWHNIVTGGVYFRRLHNLEITGVNNELQTFRQRNA